MEVVAEVTAQHAMKGTRWAIDKIENLYTNGFNPKEMLKYLKKLESELDEALAELEYFRNQPRGGVLVIPPKRGFHEWFVLYDTSEERFIFKLKTILASWKNSSKKCEKTMLAGIELSQKAIRINKPFLMSYLI